jgi:hypothetical protein
VRGAQAELGWGRDCFGAHPDLVDEVIVDFGDQTIAAGEDCPGLSACLT